MDRDVLYGDALLEHIAESVLNVVASGEWQESEAADDERDCYPFTISVHRDWLTTPHQDLGGRMPRELLHGGLEWSDRVIWGQRIRFEDGGAMIAAPDDWDGFDAAPMCSQEICLYFDLCRELIGASWIWCESEHGKLARANEELARIELTRSLRDLEKEWPGSSLDAGSPPNFIIECDCPIYEMMADGMFGVGFTSIDGHHLKLDNEFAFSKIETREAWEKQQQEDAEFHAEWELKRAEREANGETDLDFLF